RTACDSLTAPPCARSGFVSPAAMSLARSPMRFEMMSPSIEARVSAPMPPMFTPTKMTASPKCDQWVDMSTLDSPVTQIVETAVKSASTSGVTERSAVAIGSDSIAVVTRIRPAKTVIAKRDGECVVTKRNQCQIDLMMRLSAASPGAAWLPGIPVSPLLVRMNSDHRNARASVPCCICLRCHTLRTMADIFDVIADGTRREILQLLLKRGQDGDGGTSVSEIVAELSVS